MPILTPTTDIYPADLLDRPATPAGDDRSWWALYTLSRQEKRLMRQLHAQGVPFYCPMVMKRYRSPSGRIRASQLPLFTNYVFLFGDESQRQTALTTNTVSRSMLVPDSAAFGRELRQIRRLIDTGAPLTPERRIEAGALVRVRSGAFAGFEGIVVRRQNETRLLVAVNFLRQGASVLLEDCQLEQLD